MFSSRCKGSMTGKFRPALDQYLNQITWKVANLHAGKTLWKGCTYGIEVDLCLHKKRLTFSNPVIVGDVHFVCFHLLIDK